MRLHLMLQHGSLGVLTGEISAGRSTLIRHLIRSLDPLRFQPVYLVQAGMKPRDFYGDLLRHFGEETPFFLEKARQLFYKTLLQRYQQRDRFLVVFLDEALSQRVRLQYHLAELTAEETGSYIRHQMKGAGFSTPLFSETAVKLIHSDTKGIPRLINYACTHALFTAKKSSSEVIEAPLITRIIQDSARQKGYAT